MLIYLLCNLCLFFCDMYVHVFAGFEVWVGCLFALGLEEFIKIYSGYKVFCQKICLKFKEGSKKIKK